jgi:hypothetical protein
VLATATATFPPTLATAALLATLSLAAAVTARLLAPVLAALLATTLAATLLVTPLLLSATTVRSLLAALSAAVLLSALSAREPPLLVALLALGGVSATARTALLSTSSLIVLSSTSALVSSVPLTHRFRTPRFTALVSLPIRGIQNDPEWGHGHESNKRYLPFTGRLRTVYRRFTQNRSLRR